MALSACTGSPDEKELDRSQDLRRPSLLESVSLSDGGSEFRLQAVSFALEDDSVWLSGTEGVYVIGDPLAATSTGADTSADEEWADRWRVHRFDEPELQFRDVQAISSDRAVLLAAGVGSASRLYRTDDGGASWQLAWQGKDPALEGDPAVFLDCLAFWNRDLGLAYGDAVDSKLFLLRTTDGGKSWIRLEHVPQATTGEGGFASSGDCVQVGDDGWAGVVTGAGEQPRLLTSSDYGDSWESQALPGPKGSAAGAFALAVANRSEPMAGSLFVGVGDLNAAEGKQQNVFRSEDGGASWAPLVVLPFEGAVYGLAVSPGLAASSGSNSDEQRSHEQLGALIAVGPGGVAKSMDGGRTFDLWTEAEHWSVAFETEDRGLMVGPSGRLTRFSVVTR